MKKAIIFGPWTGEFSYEISWWIPEIRKLKNTRFPNHKGIMIGVKGRQALYKDFVDDYVPLPDELKKLITYPSMHGVFVEGQHIIPNEIVNFTKQVIADYKKSFDEIKFYPPGTSLLEKVMQQNPDGEYKNLKVDPKMVKVVKKKLAKFKKKRPIVAVMANLRYRDGKLEPKIWNPKNWQKFIIRLIDDLKLNVVLMGVPRKDDYPGALSIKDCELLKDYKDQVIDYVFEGDDTLDHQIALLSSVKCSVWGSTGAIVLAYLTQTPAFGFIVKEHGYRFQLEWQKKLTEGHKNVTIYDPYPMGKVFDVPADEIFEEFKKFYKKLTKKR